MTNRPRQRRIIAAELANTGAVLTLTGSITQRSVQRLTRALDNSAGPLTIVISSHGGDLHSAIAMQELMRLRRDMGEVITTIGLGAVMSAAVMLLVAGSPGQRFVGRRTRIMYHGSSIRLKEGPAARLHRDITAVLSHDREFDAIVAECTGRSVEELQALYAEGDCWLSPAQARKLGFIDRVL